MTSSHQSFEHSCNQPFDQQTANPNDSQQYSDELERIKSLCSEYEVKLQSLETFVNELSEENQVTLKSNSDLIDETSRLTDQLAECYASSESINQTNRLLEAKIDQLLTGCRLDVLSTDELQSISHSLARSLKLFEKELALRDFCKQFGIDQSILTDGTGHKFSLIDSHRKLQDQLAETQSMNQAINQSVNEFREREKQWVNEKQSMLDEKSKLMETIYQSTNQSTNQSFELQALKQSIIDLERRCQMSEEEVRKLRQNNLDLNEKLLLEPRFQSENQPINQSINHSINRPINQSENQSINRMVSHPEQQSINRMISQPRTPVHIEYNYSTSPAIKPAMYLASPRSNKQPINQNNQPFNQNNPSINQSTNQQVSQFGNQNKKSSPFQSPAVSPRAAPKATPVNQSFNQSTNQSINRIPHIQTATQSRPRNSPINQSVNPPPVSQSANQLTNQSINQSINQSNNQSINQHQHTPFDRSRPHQRRSSTATSLESLMQSACYYTPSNNQSPNQSTNQSNNQSISQSINQSTNNSLPSALRDITAQQLQYIDQIPAPQNRSIKQPIKQSAKLSMHQMSPKMNQSTSQSINQSINQSSPRIRAVLPTTKIKPPTPLTKSANQSINQSAFSVRPAFSAMQRPTAASASKRVMR